MPKRKHPLDLIAEMSDSDNDKPKTAKKAGRKKPLEVLADVSDSDNDEPKTTKKATAKQPEIDPMRDELLRLSEIGELEKTVAYIKKASKKTIEKIYAEQERLKTTKTNGFITDMLISKWADLLGGLDAIESSEELTKELQRDQLLRKDVLRAVEKLTPFVPFIGLLSGGATTAKHVYNHKDSDTTTTEPTESPTT